MKTSYNDALPKVDVVDDFINQPENETEYGHCYTWEDGGGTEIRIISDGTTTIITMYDHESSDNHFPDNPEKQLSLKEISDEATELLEKAKKDLQWDWDDSGEIWYTAAFWSENNNWHTSPDWEEQHDEDSIEWLINELRDSTQL